MPEVLDRTVIDEVVAVERRGRAGDGAPGRRAARACSSGSPPAPPSMRALELAGRPEMDGKRIVTIACDGGERYMSLPFFAA